MKIADRIIGGVNPPYIVAEISGNHCGSLVAAKQLVKAAKRAGAHAVKTQCYEPDTITLDCRKPDFIVQGGLWQGMTLHELYGRAHTPFKWHKELFKVAKDEDITIFSSVFDKSSIDFLETLGCPAYKIASFEIVDIPLIEYAASTGKPLIISTGLASDMEVKEANEASGGSACFLHCTSDYPGTVEHANLARIGHLDDLLGSNNPIGISDHTLSSIVPIAATTMRARVIEKHLRLDLNEEGTKSEDYEFSLNPTMFKIMVESALQTHEAMQVRTPEKSPSRQFRRSLYVVKDIKKGDLFTEENIRSVRPGYGLPPKRLKSVLGRRANRDFRRGDPLTL